MESTLPGPKPRTDACRSEGGVNAGLPSMHRTSATSRCRTSSPIAVGSEANPFRSASAETVDEV
eukprot:5606500-Prymnesium_polylepis.1